LPEEKMLNWLKKDLGEIGFLKGIGRLGAVR
jgi:hypothetical protein